MPLATIKKYWVFLLALLTIVTARLIQITIQPPSLTGYDYGFYRFSTMHPNPASLKHFMTGVFGGFDHIILALIGQLGYVDLFLVGSITLWSILTGWLMYLVCKPYGKKSAIYALVLLTFSLAQSQVITSFLWKTAIGLPLLLIFIFSIQKKNYFLTVASVLGLIISHTTSLLITTLVTLHYCLKLVFKKNVITLFIVVILTVLGIVLVYLNQDLVNSLLHFPNPAAYQGIFLDPWYYLQRQWPIIISAIFGLIIFYRKNYSSSFSTLLIISFLWICCFMPFNQRVVLYFDLAAIFFASFALTQIPKKYYLNILIPGIIILYSVGAWWLQINSNPPLITEAEIIEIENFKPQTSGGFLLAIDANDAPWLLGYANNLRLGAPGLFEDKHNQEAWEKFWDNQNPIEFLNTFPQPLFIYSRSSIIPETAYPCLSQLSQNIWEYDCN